MGFSGPSLRLSKPLVGDDGRVYACSENYFFAFGSNGSIDWSVHLDFKCDVAMAPLFGGPGKVSPQFTQTLFVIYTVYALNLEASKLNPV